MTTSTDLVGRASHTVASGVFAVTSAWVAHSTDTTVGALALVGDAVTSNTNFTLRTLLLVAWVFGTGAILTALTCRALDTCTALVAASGTAEFTAGTSDVVTWVDLASSS